MHPSCILGRRFLGWVLRLALTDPARGKQYRGLDKYRDLMEYFRGLRQVIMVAVGKLQRGVPFQTQRTNPKRSDSRYGIKSCYTVL